MTETSHDRAIGKALFGLGVFLPLGAGGNVLLNWEPDAALRTFVLVAIGVCAVIATAPQTSPAPAGGSRMPLLWLIIFFFWWAATVLVRPAGPRALFELTGLAAGVALHAALTWRPPSPAHRAPLAWGLLAGVLVTAIYGQYQYWVMFERMAPLVRAEIGHEAILSVNANFYNANCYGAFLGAALVLCAGVFRADPRPVSRLVLGAGLLVLSFTLALTGSRAVWGLVAAVLVTLGWLESRLPWWLARPWLAGAVAVALAGAAVAGIDFAELWEVATLGRVAIWRGALAMIRDHWLLGVGAGQFGAFFDSYRVTDYYTRYPHSLLLETFAESGVAGITALVLFFGAAFAGALRRTRFRGARDRASLRGTFLAAAALLALHTLIDIDWHAPANSILLLVLLASAGSPLAAAEEVDV